MTIILFSVLSLGATWDMENVDPSVGDMLGFTPLETIEQLPDWWPGWAVDRFFRLDPKAQKLVMDRQRRGEVAMLGDRPYTGLNRAVSTEYGIEAAWMRKADRETVERWDRPPLHLDRKRGSRYLYLDVPQYAYFTKMFVYGGDAEITQDFKGHGAITSFDETKLLRVDVFDGKGFLGTAINAPVAKWVQVWSELGGDPNEDSDVEGLCVKQDLNDNYVVEIINRRGSNNNEVYAVYFTRNGKYRWERELTIGAFTNYSIRYGTILIDHNHDVVGMADAADAGITNEQTKLAKYKIKQGDIVWTTTVSGSIARDMAELGTGGFVTVGGETDAFPQNAYGYKYTEGGIQVNWGNGSSSLNFRDGGEDIEDGGYVYDVCVGDDGNIYCAGYFNEPSVLDGGWLGQYDGTPGATEGDVLCETQYYEVNAFYGICKSHGGGKIAAVANGAKWDPAHADEVIIALYDPSVSCGWDRFIWSGLEGVHFTTNAYSKDISIQPTDDGGYIVCGTTTDNEMGLAKADARGKLEWYHTFHEHDGWDARGNFAIQTTDGGYLAVGKSTPPNGYSRAYFVKTNRYGETRE